MTAARSLIVWAIYLAVLGLGLMTVPNLLLGLFAFPPTDDVWIRLVGMLMLVLAFYYVAAARSDNRALMRWSVPARAVSPFVFESFAILGLAPAMIVTFGLVDLAGAALTWIGLRTDARITPAD